VLDELLIAPPEPMTALPPFDDAPPTPLTTGSVLPLPQPTARTKQEENIAQIERFNMGPPVGRQ
jgi:hypothetical protein